MPDPTIVIGWESATAAGTTVAAGIVAGVKMLTAYLAARDDRHQRQIDGVVAAFTAEVKEARVTHQRNTETLLTVQRDTVGALGELKIAVQSLAYRVDRSEGGRPEPAEGRPDPKAREHRGW